MNWDHPEDGFERSSMSRRKKRKEGRSTAHSDPFKPWYRPRKQWVRRNQWCSTIREHIDAIKNTPKHSTDRVYRYFTLPGPDMMDVWLVREICAEADFTLWYTGVNHVDPAGPDESQMNLQEDQIKGLGSVQTDSEVVRARFESVAKDDSRTFERLTDTGPYDALNIDLCDGVADGRERDDEFTTIDAIARIIEYQFNHAHRPWLLFLTSRSGKDQVAQRNLREFISAIQKNVQDSQRFSHDTKEWLGQDAVDLIGLIEGGLSSGDLFKDIFCLGFCKWMLKYLSSAGCPPEVSLLPSACYSVKFKSDMVALAFRIGPRPPQPLKDAYQLANAPIATMASSEEELALRMIPTLKSMVNVDILLSERPDLVNELINDTEDLLKKAGIELPKFREKSLSSILSRAAADS